MKAVIIGVVVLLVIVAVAVAVVLLKGDDKGGPADDIVPDEMELSMLKVMSNLFEPAKVELMSAGWETCQTEANCGSPYTVVIKAGNPEKIKVLGLNRGMNVVAMTLTEDQVKAAKFDTHGSTQDVNVLMNFIYGFFGYWEYIFISVFDEATTSFSAEKRQAFADALGVKLPELMKLGFREGYVAVISNSGYVFEERSKDKIINVSVSLTPSVTPNQVVRKLRENRQKMEAGNMTPEEHSKMEKDFIKYITHTVDVGAIKV